MATVAAILDGAQEYLHDSGTLWSRAELLDYLNAGYHRLLVETQAIRRLLAMDTPARYTYAITQPWEREYVGGTAREWLFYTTTGGQYACTYRWEIEHLLGATPEASENNCTQLWERFSSLQVTVTDRFFHGADHLRTNRILYNDQRMFPTSVQELDKYSNVWEGETGTPLWYTRGLAHQKQFELWQAVSSDTQTISTPGGALGVPRGWSGRTYSVNGERSTQGYAFTSRGIPTSSFLTGPGYKFTLDTTVAADYQVVFSWEKQHLEGSTVTADQAYRVTHQWEATERGLSERTIIGLGTVRKFSGGRQYLSVSGSPYGNPCLGTLRYWASSTNNVLVDYAVSAPKLAEADSPTLLPSAFDKYLKYYVLFLAFGRDGEGKNAALSAHFESRWTMGISLLKKLGHATSQARTYQLEGVRVQRSRPPKPRLPATYPAIR